MDDDKTLQVPEASLPVEVDTAPGDRPGRRSRAFRDRLLARLPRLAVPEWRASEAFDIQKDLKVIGEFGADAFLEPLARRPEARDG